MALIHTPCGAGVQTGIDPETQQTAVDVQTEMIGMQAGVVNAQAAANSIYTRSPFDYVDMGLNIFADVARQNAQGAGGPAGKTAAIGYSGAGVPFGPRCASPISCEPDPPGVDVVPLNMSTSLYPNQPKLTTRQGIDVPSVPQVWRSAWSSRPRRICPAGPITGKQLSNTVPTALSSPVSPIQPTVTAPGGCQRPPRTGNVCLDLVNGALLDSEVDASVLWACSQKGYSQAGVKPLPCVYPPGPKVAVSPADLASVPLFSSVGMSGYSRDQNLAGGAYPVVCGPVSVPMTSSSGNGISPWWWLALAGVALFAFSGGNR